MRARKGETEKEERRREIVECGRKEQKEGREKDKKGEL